MFGDCPMIFSCLPSTAPGTIYEKYDLTSTLPFLQFVYIYIYIKKMCIYKQIYTQVSFSFFFLLTGDQWPCMEELSNVI